MDVPTILTNAAAIYGAVAALATIIIKLTPTQKDDAILAKVLAFMDKWLPHATTLKPTEPVAKPFSKE